MNHTAVCADAVAAWHAAWLTSLASPPSDGRHLAGTRTTAARGRGGGGAVGVFGVTTVAAARSRGYGTALTRAAMLTETGLPAVLAPSEMAEPMYLRLGFRRVGELLIWSKAP